MVDCSRGKRFGAELTLFVSTQHRDRSGNSSGIHLSGIMAFHNTENNRDRELTFKHENAYPRIRTRASIFSH